jgi:hypothetical protein
MLHDFLNAKRFQIQNLCHQNAANPASTTVAHGILLVLGHSIMLVLSHNTADNAGLHIIINLHHLCPSKKQNQETCAIKVR